MNTQPATASSPTASLEDAPRSGDNLLGICAAIGEDFGFNPLWLRIALAMAVLVNVEIAIGTYVALGLIVAISRVLVPARGKLSATV